MPRTLVTALCLGLLVLAGCAAEQPRREVAPAPQPTVTDRPSAAPTSAASTPSPAPDDTRSRRPVPPAATSAPGHRDQGSGLTVTRGDSPGARLLGAGDLGPRWSVTATGAEDEPVSRCHRVPMRDIGAEDVRVRRFAGGEAAAAQGVARFVDRRSAWRAARVVAAWREGCDQDLQQRDAALGAVRHGSWLSVVEVAGVRRPQRHLDRALATAAGRLG